MKNRAFLLLGLFGCAHHTNHEPEQPLFPALANVRAVYIDHLGNEVSSAMVREKLRTRLAHGGRFVVVELPTKADAILSGAAGVNQEVVGGPNGVWTRYSGWAAVRMVSTVSGDTVWFYEYQPPRRTPKSASSHVADQIAKTAVKDALKAESPQ